MITVSSDFRSYYPAAMRGVILQQTDTRVVDVTHDLPRQDVRSGAFWLRELLPYFPPAVHLVVLDPGVGTDRDAIVVRAGDHTFVGPDNGVLLPVARRLGDGNPDVYRVVVRTDTDDTEYSGPTADDAEWWPPTAVSNTFHGRDVFAPAAARVHEVVSLDSAGFDPVESYVDLRFPDPTVRDDHATGEILAVDDFGNVISNLPGAVLASQECFGDSLAVNGVTVPAVRTYGGVAAGERLVTVGSHGQVELAVNQGQGDDAFGLQVGDSVELRWS